MINEKEVLARALRVWGKVPQMLQAVEEMSELTKEIIKNINRGKNNLAELVEETADVEIMLEQLKICYGIPEQVADYKAGKLEKLNHRLDEEEKSA